MRHRKGNRKLSKPTDQRIALLRSLVLSLITYNRIVTTEVRAKEAQKYAEKLITLAKKGDVHSRRQALKHLPNKDVVKLLFESASRFSNRNGGYTRTIKAGFRKGDGSPVSILELVG